MIKSMSFCVLIIYQYNKGVTLYCKKISTVLNNKKIELILPRLAKDFMKCIDGLLGFVFQRMYNQMS